MIFLNQVTRRCHISSQRLVLGFCVSLSGLFAPSAAALDDINLQLKYLHQFQFAGYYAALEQGYYREAGLDVHISEGISGKEPLENVLSGKSQFGVGSSSLLLERHAGKPVVVLGVVFQHSPYVLLTPKTTATQTIHDIAGKSLMLAAQSEEIIAYLKKEGIALDGIKQLEHSFKPDDLINGKVYGFSAYSTNETDYLDRAGFAYQAYTPRSAGIDFYGDNLFTSEQEIAKHPARVRAFREASMRGWQYAMSHTEEISDLILAKYSQRNSREHLLYEAKQMMPLLQPVLVEMGYMNPGRWQHIGEVYAELGMLPKHVSLDGFLYEPNPRLDLVWWYRALAAVVLIAACAWLIHIKHLSTERGIARARIKASEERLNFAMQGAGYGVWDWDIPSGTVMYSERWREMHGYQQDEVPNCLEGWEQRVHPDDLSKIKVAMLDYLKGKSDSYVNEHRALNKDGSWKWVVDRGMVVSRDAHGKPLRMVCTHADISERKQYESNLQHLNEQLELRVEERTRELSLAMQQVIQSEKLASLGSLVAGISHELNTPIGNTLMVASTLNDRISQLDALLASGHISRSKLHLLLEDCQNASALIMRNSQRSGELIASFKRVAVDQTSERRRNFDLHILVQDILNALGPAIRRAKAEVEIRIAAGLQMDSYPGYLEQILSNLVMNSLHHGFNASKSGHILISAQQLIDSVELVYQDDGLGIAKELQHRVFEPFYTTKLGQGGSGLGLSIVYNLTHAIFKGKVQLESEAGHGLRIVFNFPLLPPEQ
ncbi:ABC transporter substrate-binding protein [Undibacterium parvum]|uniref:histidine kinase n=1 Tax=Undibacterium parvum TaxID=401471 RepID=A0A3S9HIA6_9BURK|nr:ABC transporter substrate-binding protein [Undibacterium parvum]AZP11834.1 PAS domain S-box protein [Undibacterium parvum]